MGALVDAVTVALTWIPTLIELHTSMWMAKKPRKASKKKQKKHTTWIERSVIYKAADKQKMIRVKQIVGTGSVRKVDHQKVKMDDVKLHA